MIPAVIEHLKPVLKHKRGQSVDLLLEIAGGYKDLREWKEKLLTASLNIRPKSNKQKGDVDRVIDKTSIGVYSSLIKGLIELARDYDLKFNIRFIDASSSDKEYRLIFSSLETKKNTSAIN